MANALELTLALRYLRARQASRFASFMSLASMIGIAIGVCALITILSVMNGFEAELRGRLLGLQTEASVAARSGELSDWEQLRDRVLELPKIIGAAPSVSVEGMANADGRLVPVLIEGIDPELERSISSLDESMVSGRLDALESDDFGVILGRYLALDLGVETGDDIVMLVPRPTVAGVQPELVRLRVVGVFNAGVPEYDGGVGWMHWSDAAAMLGGPPSPSALRLKLEDAFSAPQVSADLSTLLGDDYTTTDWTRENASYFRAIRLEKAMMAMILGLVIGVAAFNIIASLVMVVSDKSTDIAILRTLGLSPRRVVRVFFTQGLILGWFGVLLGVALGVALSLNVTEVVAWLERSLGFQIMPGDVYVMTAIPSELHQSQVWWVGALALGLTALATIYPARKAAAVHPAQALRYG